MKKLIVTVGISNSGKSTFAHEYWLKNQRNSIIVNRDKIRELLYGYTEESIKNYYQYSGAELRSFEKEITRYENILIQEGLSQNKTVIVDATHLRRTYLERFIYYNVPVELKFFNISLEDALERNNKRTRKVGEDVIKRQLKDYTSLINNLKDTLINFEVTEIKSNISLPEAYIFDIDGTLARIKDRNPYDFTRVLEDDIDLNVADTAFLLKNDFDTDIANIICTGRDKRAEEDTKKWLKKYGISYTEFHIRERGDYRPDWKIKEEMWRDISTRYNIVGIFDDRRQVVDRARSLGLKVFQVEYHNF